LISLLSKLLVAGVAAALVAIPPLQSRVTDLTGTLSAQQRGALEQTLAEFEARKGAQIAVLIVPTTQPETVEQYAVRVEEAWKLGRKGVDDSVLFLISKEDRELRLEVGYGLEGALPDAAAKRIIEDDITPRFKQGDFYGGIRAGVDRIMRTVEGEPLPAPRRQAARPVDERFMQWLVPGLFAALVFGGILRMLLGRVLGSTVVGGLAGAIVWGLTGLLAFGIGAAVLVFLFSVLGGMSGRGWGGGWGGGGWGGGGWSGGGGSSGGGGASGRW
jgi:uncharacterized protein